MLMGLWMWRRLESIKIGKGKTAEIKSWWKEIERITFPLKKKSFLT